MTAVSRALPAGSRRPRCRGDTAQATVELAVMIPMIATLALLVIQIGVLIHDQVLVIHAAREGARAAAVDQGSPAAAQRAAYAASALPLGAGSVATATSGSSVQVTVRHTNHTDVPLIGALLPDITVQGRANMQIEPGV